MILYISYLLLLAITTTYSQCTPKKINFDTLPLNDITIDYNKNNVIQRDNKLLLSLTKDTGGTRITLNNKIHYGTIEASMKVSHGSNIVSSFILMADNGDEIDFEFVGKDNSVVQTNFFYKGIPIYDKNAKFYNTFKDLTSTFNTYKITWTPYYYQWSINGVLLRTLLKNQTKTFPDSPSNIQIGIWLAQNSKWAGDGPKWNESPFNVSISTININCIQNGDAGDKETKIITTKTPTKTSVVRTTQDKSTVIHSTQNSITRTLLYSTQNSITTTLLYYTPTVIANTEITSTTNTESTSTLITNKNLPNSENNLSGYNYINAIIVLILNFYYYL